MLSLRPDAPMPTTVCQNSCRRTAMIRLRHADHSPSAVAALPNEPLPFLDARVVSLLGDGRLRTVGQVAVALTTAPEAVEASLLRLAAQRRVLRAGHVAPEERGYGVAWPKLWGLVRRAR
jgi:hypothetical protein